MKTKSLSIFRVLACLIAISIFILSFVCYPINNSNAFNESTRYIYFDSSTNKRDSYTLDALSVDNNTNTRGGSVPENRVLDSDTSVVQLSHIYKNVPSFGTGFIIGSHLIATCAHVVYDRANDKFFAQDQIYNIIIKDENSNTIKTISSSSSKMQFHVPSNYHDLTTSDAIDSYDYALIYVEEDLSQYGIFEVGVVTDDFLNNNCEITTSGFPAEINYGGTTVLGTRYKSVGNAEYYQDNTYDLTGELRFASTNCTSGGDSGGPAYFTYNNYDGQEENVVIGIVTGGTMEKDEITGEYRYTGTSGVRVTTNILHFFFHNNNIGK